MGLSLFLYQPIQGFLAGLEGGQRAAGKAFHILVEDVREIFKSHPGRLPYVWAVEDGALFDTVNCFPVKLRPCKVAENQR